MDFNDESDDRLMERAASGDTAAFDQIVRRHQHRVQRFASRMFGGDQSRAADVAVGAFLRLWENRGTFVPCGQLGGWLLKTANRLCLDALSRDRPTCSIEEVGAESSGLHSCVERTVLAGAVRDAVMELPEAHRSVLILSVYEEMSYDEIAAVLDVPPGTVASRKNHAISMLKRRLAAWETR